MIDHRLAVVVLAAGEGTRMRSATPKVLHPIAGLPMIAHVLGSAAALEPDRIIVVVRHERDRVAAAVAEHLDGAVIVDQDAVPGTGRAVESALPALDGFDGEVLVVSGDVPLLDAERLASLVAAHRAASAAATILSAVLDDPTGYGRVIRGDGSTGTSTGTGTAVLRIVEHRDASEAELVITEINSGSYVFAVAALREHLPQLGSDNSQGERYLTDLIARLTAAGSVVAATQIDRPELVEGVNDRAQLAVVAARLNAAIVRGWQLAGVSIKDPATTWIDTRVTIEPDVEVLPNTHLAGATTIARGATIGPDTTLRDCEVGEGATVTRTDATLAVIEARATVGPWAYLRANTRVGEGGKIGTFVETKNSQLGAGTKVPHLSYIGDTTVGEGSNIGAGTITANYDGVNKHRTTVGSHVRTASHNVFVAPVRIGDGAYTGAGTVVRKDVPAGSLAVNVAPQRNIQGWVGQKRPGTEAAEAAEAASAAGVDILPD